MRKILSAFLVLNILYLVFGPIVWAQAPTGTQSAKVDYDLPYPGILPDSPLYLLKTFRDKVISLFISDPVKKAEFDLLTADKRLASGLALFDKEKYDLAESTISKGENYFEDAIKNIKLARMQGRPIDLGLLTNIELSARKHVEVLEEMVNKSSGDLKARFLKDLERANKFFEEVTGLRAKL